MAIDRSDTQGPSIAPAVKTIDRYDRKTIHRSLRKGCRLL
jgi:hypothetical protein